LRVRNDRSGIADTKARAPICGSGKGMAHASITCCLACHNFIAGFRAQYGNSGAGMHRGVFSLRRKRTSPRPSPRAGKCRAGLASDPGKLTWGKGCRQYVPRQQSDSLPTRHWQQGLALFRPWCSVPYRLKKPAQEGSRAIARSCVSTTDVRNYRFAWLSGDEPLADGSAE